MPRARGAFPTQARRATSAPADPVRRMQEHVTTNLLAIAERHRPDLTAALDVRTLAHTRTYVTYLLGAGAPRRIRGDLDELTSSLRERARHIARNHADQDPAFIRDLTERAERQIAAIADAAERPADEQREYATTVAPTVAQAIAQLAREALTDALREPGGDSADLINTYTRLIGWRTAPLDMRDGILFARAQNLTEPAHYALSSLAVNLRNAPDAITSLRDRPRALTRTVEAAGEVIEARTPVAPGRTHRGRRAEIPCAHDGATWHPSASVRTHDPDTLTLACEVCGIDRLATVALHRVHPDDHYAAEHLPAHRREYMQVESLHRELRGQAPVPEHTTIEELRGADGAVDLNQVREQAIAAWHRDPTAGARIGARSLREVINRR